MSDVRVRSPIVSSSWSELRTRRGLVLAATALLLLLAGCGGAESEQTDTASGEFASAAMLECESEGYPCSLGDVPIEILKRSDEIGGDVLGMLASGSSTEEIGEWLNGVEGMAEVEFDDLAVRFRLDGGRGTWILREGAFATRSAPGEPAPGWVPKPALPMLHKVVGEGREEKRAIVVSPFQYEFGGLDDGPVVQEILAKTRGYEGRVEFFGNETKTDAKAGVASFKGWGAFDVVHVSSHGKRLCVGDDCRGIVFAAALESVLPPGPGAEIDKIAGLEVIHERGVGIAFSEATGNRSLFLTADFFRDQYPNGLTDTLVYFSACQTLGAASDLASALQGSTSVFVGWTEAVNSGDAVAAAEQFYQYLSEQGYPAEVAYDKLGGLTTGAVTEYSPNPPRLVLSGRPAGGDLRIREVVTLVHPDTGQELGPSAEIAIEGVADDGEDDQAPYRVRVEGIMPEFTGEVTVHVEIDGVAAEPQTLDNAESIEEDQWEVSGAVSLDYDLEEDKLVDVRAWAELHSGGQSEHIVSATLTGAGECLIGSWQIDGSGVEAIVKASLGDVAETVFTNGTVTAHFDGDGTVTFDFDGWEFGNTTFTPAPIEGMADLHGGLVTHSEGTASGTYAITDTGQLDLNVGDFATTVTQIMTVADVPHTIDPDQTGDPNYHHLARLYVIPGAAMTYQCTNDILTWPWQDQGTITWHRTP